MVLASGSDYHTVRLWDPATGRYYQTLEGHTVCVLVFLPGGKVLASGYYDNTVRLWDPTPR
ncbi:WD40-repeat-containing domain protein [Aspergillus spectabilis]